VFYSVLQKIPQIWFNRVFAREVLKFSTNIYISALVGQISGRSADLLIGVLAGPAAAGAFRLSGRVVSGINDMVCQPAITVAWVQLSGGGHDIQKIKEEWQRLTIFISIIVWPALAVLACNTKNVLHVIVGPGWEEAAPLLVVMALDRGLSIAVCFIGPLLGIRNRTGTTLRFSFVSGIGTILAMLLCARYGALSAALGQLAITTILSAVGVAIIIDSEKFRTSEFFCTFALGGVFTAVIVASGVLSNSMFATLGSPAKELCVTLACTGLTWFGLLLCLNQKVLRVKNGQS
jgi:O-antigen/teichoic acid export membrane protein